MAMVFLSGWAVLVLVWLVVRRRQGAPVRCAIPCLRGCQIMDEIGTAFGILVPAALFVKAGTSAAVVIYGMLAASLSVGVWSRVQQVRVRKVVLAYHGRVCPRCVYPLPEGGGEMVGYPECGGSWNAEEVATMWHGEPMMGPLPKVDEMLESKRSVESR